jgi:high-affinity Fe2+/Pb2+ permease
MWFSGGLLTVLIVMAFLPAEEKVGDEVSTLSWVLYGIVLGLVLSVFIRAAFQHFSDGNKHNKQRRK